MKKHPLLSTALWIVLVAVLASCGGGRQFIARNTTAPPIKHCNDITGHQTGAVPFILGGTCTCTPTEALYQQCVNEGTIKKEMTYKAFLQLFTDAGVKTDLDHKGCNNGCQWGPNVVFGGKCMATPTPGTLNYERVVSGNQALTRERNQHEIEQ